MASAIGRCKICGEQLNYQTDDITAFGRHLIEKHNEEITHFQFPGTECDSPILTNAPSPDSSRRTYKTTGT